MSGQLEGCWTAKTGIINSKDCRLCSVDPYNRLSDVDDYHIRHTFQEHGNVLVRGLSRQRTEGRHLDCVLSVDTASIPVHRSILTSFSEYIDNLFQYGEHPLLQPRNLAVLPPIEKQRSVNLDHLSAKAVGVLIGGAYGDDILTPSDGEMEDLHHAADFLCIPTVTGSATTKLATFEREAFLAKLLSDLCEQRKSGEYIDCIVAIGSLRICAHQMVLSAFSQYFNDLRCWKEDIEKDSRFQSLHPASVEALVNYAYTGEIDIISCTVVHLLRAAIYLDFDKVSDLCFKHLFACINTENCLDLYEIVAQLKCEQEMKEAREYIVRNFTEISSADAFLDLDIDTVLEFLEHDELTMMRIYQYEEETNKYFFVPPSEQEYLILQLIIRYVQRNYSSVDSSEDFFLTNSDERQKVERLLAFGVRLPLMDFKALCDLKKSTLYKSRSYDFKRIINKAIQYCQLAENHKIWLPVVYSRHWTTARRLTRLYFKKMAVSSTRLNQTTNQCVYFDDSKQFQLPVQYVTGMKMFTRAYNGLRILGGLQVTYNHNRTVLHGSANIVEDGSFQFDNDDERIIAFRSATLIPVSYLMHSLAFDTNKGRLVGYGGIIGLENMYSIRPSGSLYLAYLSGSVDVIGGESTLRDLQFVFATDSQSKK